jgi:hypothetical protein
LELGGILFFFWLKTFQISLQNDTHWRTHTLYYTTMISVMTLQAGCLREGKQLNKVKNKEEEKKLV